MVKMLRILFMYFLWKSCICCRQPWFGDWGFNLERGEEMLEKWNWIPERTDILITHGPPVGKIVVLG